jgi:hypothetical protein
MNEPIPCPQCGAPAQITERFRLDSTDGPVEHVKTGCERGHWFTPTVGLAPPSAHHHRRQPVASAGALTQGGT